SDKSVTSTHPTTNTQYDFRYPNTLLQYTRLCIDSIALNQSHPRAVDAQQIDPPGSVRRMGPLRSFAQQPEEHVELRGVEAAAEGARRAARPTRRAVRAHALLDHLLRPTERQAREIDLARPDAGVFPVNRVDPAATIQRIVGVIITMDDRVGHSGKNGDGLLESPHQWVEPPRLGTSLEAESSERPEPTVARIGPVEDGANPRCLSLVARVEVPDPCRRGGHGVLLWPSPADVHASGDVLDDQPCAAGARFLVLAVIFRRRHRRAVDHLTIDGRFITSAE